MCVFEIYEYQTGFIGGLDMKLEEFQPCEYKGRIPLRYKGLFMLISGIIDFTVCFPWGNLRVSGSQIHCCS